MRTRAEEHGGVGQASHGRNLAVGLKEESDAFTLQGVGQALGSRSSTCGGVTGALGSRCRRGGGAGEG